MKHVLITGATGVLGSELVPRFVRDPDVTVHLLIRANDKTHLHARLVDLFQYWELSPDDPRAQQIRAYQGDVCADQLGVSDELYRRFQSLLTHIVHSAGNVKLNQPVAAARQHAVGSVRNILALTNACQTNGQFEKLDAVSTIGVAGMRSGMIQEVRLPTPERGYRNTYEQAKAEAEEILWQASADGLPLTVHRPSMIVGDANTGKVLTFQVFYYLCEFLTGRRSFGIVPEMGTVKLDIIPVDCVADAIHASCFSSHTTGKVYHLCTGDSDSLPLRDLANRLREMYRSRGISLPTTRTVPLSVLTQASRLLQYVGTKKIRKTTSSLVQFLRYLATEQSFDTSQYDLFRAECSLRRPTPETYLELLVDQFLQGRAKRAEVKQRSHVGA